MPGCEDSHLDGMVSMQGKNLSFKQSVQGVKVRCFKNNICEELQNSLDKLEILEHHYIAAEKLRDENHASTIYVKTQAQREGVDGNGGRHTTAVKLH